MPVRRFLVPLALAAAVAVAGCTRNQTRRDPLRRQAQPGGLVPPVTAAGQQPFTPPTPPAPPPLPQTVSPTPANDVAQLTPRAALPAAMTASPPGFGTSPAGAEPPVELTQGLQPIPPVRSGPADGELASVGPVRDRLQDRREDRRDDRRDRRNPPPAVPSAPPPAPAAPPATASPAPAPTADALGPILDAARKRYAEVADFEARLVKREVVNGKPVPNDEVAYKFRKQPLSVSMKVLSPAGQGREVIFVKGRDEGAMHVVTGKGDNRLVGVGFKTTVDPDGRDAVSKSRYRIYEAGFGRSLRGLELAVEKGFTVRVVGPVQRSEYPYPLECVEVVATGPGDPSLPVGAKRSIYFDPNPDSPSYRLPVLSEMRDASGRELEHYCFDRFKTPAGLTDADFDPARLGRR